MNRREKVLVWLKGEVKTPPFSRNARLEIGLLLRKLQIGEKLNLPESKPMSDIGSNCHELRINDKNIKWRIVFHISLDAIVILEIFNTNGVENLGIHFSLKHGIPNFLYINAISDDMVIGHYVRTVFVIHLI